MMVKTFDAQHSRGLKRMSTTVQELQDKRPQSSNVSSATSSSASRASTSSFDDASLPGTVSQQLHDVHRRHQAHQAVGIANQRHDSLHHLHRLSDAYTTPGSAPGYYVGPHSGNDQGLPQQGLHYASRMGCSPFQNEMNMQLLQPVSAPVHAQVSYLGLETMRNPFTNSYSNAELMIQCSEPNFFTLSHGEAADIALPPSFKYEPEEQYWSNHGANDLYF